MGLFHAACILRLQRVARWTSLSGALVSTHAATFLWDGNNGNSASQTNWTTNNNWDPNSAPAQNAGHDLVFATSNKLSNTADNGNWTLNSLTFDATAGAFTLGGGVLQLGAGGLTNQSAATQTINNQFSLTAHQTWTAASGAITTTAYTDATGQNLTLAGNSTVTVSGQLNNVGTLTLSGAGNRSFGGNSGNQLTATTLNVQNTGTNTFNGQLNVGTLNLSSGASTFANVQAASGINVSGSANATFTGPVAGGGGGITIAGSGNIEFSGTITGGTLTLNGTGTTTLSGSGAKNITNTIVNEGTLVLDQTSGAAINGALTINDGGTVVLSGDNQIPAWQTVTLNTGSTLYLGDTTQTLASLVINGDSVIDFGGGGSQLNVTYGGITIAENITLTIVNWDASAGDAFAGANPGNTVVNVQYADNNGNIYATGTWGNNTITPGAPIPEPAAAGALLLGTATGLVLLRRRR